MRRTGVAFVATALVIAALVDGCGSSSVNGSSCDPNFSVCAGACVDTRYDRANCGGCGVSCATSSICVDGTCVAIGASSSGAVVGGSSGSTSSSGVGPSGSSSGIGADGGTESGAPHCSTGFAACSGACVDLGTDRANCGACANRCPSGGSCVLGSCGPSACAFPGALVCDGACVDSVNDAANCGGCGNVCMQGQTCSGASCGAVGSTWPTLGGDVGHSGFNAIENGKPPLTMAWSHTLGAALSPAVSDGRTVYVSSSSSASQGTTLAALSPADGHVLWTYNFGNVFAVGQPTVTDGHVFIGQCNNTPGTYMYSFVATTGQLFWSQPFSAQWEHYWAPVVVGGRVYFDGGEYGGFYALSELGGAQIFFENEDQWDSWSPTYFGGSVYTFTNGNLRAFEPAAGSLVRSTTVPWIWTGYTMNTSPVTDGTSLYVISPPNLYAFGPGLGSPLWMTNGAYSSQPAVANGVVYSISGGQFRANDASTGVVLWSFTGDSALKYPPAVAAGFVYVASDANVYALDVTQHTQVWTAATGGWLSIAGGQLLVAGQGGTLVAWSLSH